MYKKISYLKETILIVCMLAIFVCGAAFYVWNLRYSMQSDLKANLTQIASMNGEKIKRGFEDSLATLRTLSRLLEEENLEDTKQVVQKLQSSVDETIFFRFGLVDENGICYTTDGVSFDVNDRSYYHDALAGKSVFTSSLTDKVDNSRLNVFAVPLYQKGTVARVLFGSIHTKELSAVMTRDIFKGEGFSAICDQNGDIIVQPDSESRQQKVQNLKELTMIDTFTVDDLKKHTQGIAEFRDPQGNERYLAYESMGFNDWFVLSIVPKSVVAPRINEFTFTAILTWLLMAIIFAVILYYNHRMKQKNSKKMDEVIFHDTVTAHYNYNRFRMYFHDLIDRKEQSQYALCELDLNDFKMYNELYSYQEGDTLLKTIMQECDAHCAKGEYCSRISADHFILCLKERDTSIVRNRIHSIIASCLQRVVMTHSPFHIRYKCGVYFISEQDDHLSRCHDRCVYAKNQIHDDEDISISFYSQEMYEASLQDKLLEGDMKRALKEGEFKMYLQPKIDLRSEKVFGAEALVRWDSRDFGKISPNRFIPLFEKNGSLRELDIYMLKLACEQLKAWEGTPWEDLMISINVSRAYIFRTDFASRFYEVVKSYGVSPSRLDIEITESVIFDHSEELIQILNQLHAYGFRISMDDFGSGYSSLNMLKDIPLDVIKLDQVFFRSSQDHWERSKSVVRGVIRMAQDLHLFIIAEGVETQEEYIFLKNSGCDAIQGYYYAKPLSQEAFMAYIQQR